MPGTLPPAPSSKLPPSSSPPAVPFSTVMNRAATDGEMGSPRVLPEGVGVPLRGAGPWRRQRRPTQTAQQRSSRSLAAARCSAAKSTPHSEEWRSWAAFVVVYADARRVQAWYCRLTEVISSKAHMCAVRSVSAVAVSHGAQMTGDSAHTVIAGTQISGSQPVNPAPLNVPSGCPLTARASNARTEDSSNVKPARHTRVKCTAATVDRSCCMNNGSGTGGACSSARSSASRGVSSTSHLRESAATVRMSRAATGTERERGWCLCWGSGCRGAGGGPSGLRCALLAFTAAAHKLGTCVPPRKRRGGCLARSGAKGSSKHTTFAGVAAPALSVMTSPATSKWMGRWTQDPPRYTRECATALGTWPDSGMRGCSVRQTVSSTLLGARGLRAPALALVSCCCRRSTAKPARVKLSHLSVRLRPSTRAMLAAAMTSSNAHGNA